jgi:ferric-dicitrate binding protein FerR (iron transport regulator)
MTAPRYARLIAEVWKRSERRASEMPASSNRDEEIALIEQAMDRRRRKRGMRQAACWSLAATVLLAGAGLWRAHRETIARPPVAANAAGSKDTAGASPVAIAIASGSGSIVKTPGSATPAVAGRAVQAGSRLIVDPSAGATLSLSTGTHLEVEHGSELMVLEDGRAQVFALHAGSLHADVAKLGDSERFIVRTLDAEVEVRGTSFLVSVVAADRECGGGTSTRVAVYEGAVTIRSQGSEESVRAGERWPRGCRKSVAGPPAARANSQRAAKLETSPAPRGPATPLDTQPLPSNGQPSPPLRPSPSSLADENNLFAEGMLARRSGNLPLALDKMDRFIEKYPISQLAENAVVERMRLLRAIDPIKATGAARQYLQRYPGGFARADAEAILAGTR